MPASSVSYDPRVQRARMAARRRQRRRRKLARRLAGLLCLACGALWLLAAGAAPRAPMSAAGTLARPADGQAGAWDSDTRAALEALVQTQPQVQAMLDQPGRWPAEVAALLARNAEALDFVLAYPDIKDDAPPQTVGEVQQGTLPQLLQCDQRWGAASYGGGILAVTGCGPTALSMVACGLTGDGTLTPARIAAWADARGYAGAGGTSWEMMYAGGEAFGLRAEEIPLTESAVYGALEAGRPIICSVRPGDFTTVGHFIVLAGVQDGRLRVLAPNSPARSAQAWDYQRLEPQIKALWAYDAA